jgi:hypothetical protein
MTGWHTGWGIAPSAHLGSSPNLLVGAGESHWECVVLLAIDQKVEEKNEKLERRRSPKASSPDIFRSVNLLREDQILGGFSAVQFQLVEQ